MPLPGEDDNLSDNFGPYKDGESILKVWLFAQSRLQIYLSYLNTARVIIIVTTIY